MIEGCNSYFGKSNGKAPAPEPHIAELAKESFPPFESGGERAALGSECAWNRTSFSQALAKQAECNNFIL